MELLEIRERLAEKGLKYADMVALIDSGRAELVDCASDGITLCDQKTNAYFIATGSEEYAKKAAEIAKDAREITAHEEFYAQQMKEAFGFNQMIQFHHVSYQEKTPPKVDAQFDIRVLGTEFVPELVAIYEYAGQEYMQERTESGEMFGAFVDGKLAGFIGIHDGGAIGLLRVLDEFRRRGIAVALENYAIAHQMEHGVLPYAQIHDGNDASIHLQKKIGMSMAESTVYWMFNEDED